MSRRTRDRLLAYGLAVLAPAVTLLVRWPFEPWLNYHGTLMTFFPAIILSAYRGGLGPGLVATALGGYAGTHILIPPISPSEFHEPGVFYSFGLYLFAGVVISGLTDSLHRSRRRIAASERRYAVTLASIGDAVIATDVHARVTFLNPAAEALTGWPAADAVGEPLDEVFRVVNEQTRQPVESPTAKVLRTGGVVGLANHTVLRARDGRETPIDDCGAPIRDEGGAVAGVVLVFRDVSGRRRAEEAESVRRASERMELAVRGSQVGVWDIDMPEGDYRRGRRHYMNVWEQFGYDRPPAGWVNGTAHPPADEPARFAWTAADDSPAPWETTAVEIHPDDATRVGEAIRAHLAGETPGYEAEARFRCRDGSYRPMLARGRAVRDAAGTPVRFAGTLLDVTPLKRAEESVRESEERFRALMEQAPFSVMVCDPGGNIVRVNRAWEELWGVTLDRIPGYNLLRDPQLEELGVATYLRRAFAGEPTATPAVEYDVSRTVPDHPWGGSPRRWVNAVAYPLKDRDGRVREVVLIHEDITERKRAEEELRASERRFRVLVDHAADAFFLQDDQGRVLDVNRRACESLGYGREELIGMTPLDFDPAVTPAALHEIVRANRDTDAIEFETLHRHKDGTVFPVEIRGQGFSEGGRRFVVTLARDMTDRKRAEEELRRAKEAAEAANRAKDEFLANVSHELRTPMNAILGMTELALDTELTDDQRQHLTTVRSAAESLLGILNDLLDFAKIEAGKLELHPADFSLRGVVRDILRALAPRAHRKGVELIHRVAADVPDALIGDAGRLRQVLLNLVGNAVKFTDAGEVEVTVRPQPDADGPPGTYVLGVVVRDTGIGIRPDQQERIFRAFEQEDTSTTRRYGGTGLGLTISARLVELMGGTITVASEPGRGSTFAFTARFARQPHPPAQAEPPPALLSDLPVLVVDDNATNRHILAEWLRGWLMRPDEVGDAAAALDALRSAAAAGRPYPLVLLDARMPDVDGLELAGRVRDDPALAAVGIVMLSSGDRPGDAARAREVQVDSHLLKPVEPVELLAAVIRVLQRNQAGRRAADHKTTAASARPAGPPSSPRSVRVLVAEDNEFNAQLLEQLLTRRGHSVRLAANGREALALTEAGDYDVLLLDIHMPELDGFQVVRAVRERERATGGGHLPVVALTARSRTEDRERCLAAGMDDFLPKPVRAADLWAAVERFAQDGRLRAADVPPAADPAPAGPELLDPRAVLAACGGDDAILGRIGRAFRDGLPGQLAAVRSALAEGDAARLREAAHRLCGVLGAFSTTAGGVASELEDAAEQGRLADAGPLVDRLGAMAEELLRLADGLTVESLRR